MIDPLCLYNLQERFGGKVINADAMFKTVSINTRDIQTGDLFVALKGERFDAHDFLFDAVESGACAIVVHQKVDGLTIPQWVVDDTTLALGNIARLQREHFFGRLVAITGSSGKTTVKGMLLSIFQAVVSDNVFATKGNFNNHIGVPLSLLDIEPHHQYAVIEMGASALGEISYLTSLASPDVAVINNVMPAHVEGFGSVDNIAKAKGEIYDGLSEDGIAIINIDDHYASQWLLQNKHRKVITFSFNKTNVADVSVTKIQQGKEGCAGFQLHLQEELFPVQLNVMGLHNIANALAASACAHALRIDGELIAQGLESFSGVSGRLEPLVGFHDATIIDDSYNANPSSVRAAIDVLANVSAKKVLVLGDMTELGETSLQAHEDIGVYARDKKIDALLSIGTYTKAASDKFLENNKHFDHIDQLIAEAKTIADANTVFLIKGSRSSRMDRVVQALKQRGDNNVSLA